MRRTKQECIQILQTVYEYYKGNFSVTDYNSFKKNHLGFPDSNTIIKKFGSWNKAKESAGIDISQQCKSKNGNKFGRKKIILSSSEKTCNTCGIMKPLEEFHVLKSGVGGKNSKCKECYNSYKRIFHHENKERMNLKNKIYYQENLEHFKRKYQEKKAEMEV